MNATAIYPTAPGFKTGGTSAEAAFKVKGKADAIRMKCIMTLTERGDFTADELAALIQEHPDDVAPRLSELSGQGRIFKSGVRRPSARGNPSAVWTIDSQAKLF